MVDALNEIQRVLTPNGILIDLRPLAGSWPIEDTHRRVKSKNQDAPLKCWLAWKMTEPLNQAIAQAAEQKWFVREREEFFPFFYYWDSPNEMKEYIDDEWEDFISVDEATWKNVRSMWAVANVGTHVCEFM